MFQRLPLLLFLAKPRFTGGHSFGIHGLDGEPPYPEPVLTDIHGVFTATVVAKFDNLGKNFQPLLDFGESAYNNIFFGQSGTSSRMQLTMLNGSDFDFALTPPGAIVAGEVATWEFGVDQDTNWFIKKDGAVLAFEPKPFSPPLFDRTSKLIGETNYPPSSGFDSLEGAVLGIKIINQADPPRRFRVFEHMNFGGQAFKPFVASGYARFDNTGGRSNQRIFNFGNGPQDIEIALTQVSNTTDLSLEMHEGSTHVQCIAPNVLVDGEAAHWHAGVEANGTYWLEKNGVREKTCDSLQLPTLSFRRKLLFGESLWGAANHDSIDGFVLGFRLDQQDNS